MLKVMIINSKSKTKGKMAVIHQSNNTFATLSKYYFVSYKWKSIENKSSL